MGRCYLSRDCGVPTTRRLAGPPLLLCTTVVAASLWSTQQCWSLARSGFLEREEKAWYVRSPLSRPLPYVAAAYLCNSVFCFLAVALVGSCLFRHALQASVGLEGFSVRAADGCHTMVSSAGAHACYVGRPAMFLMKAGGEANACRRASPHHLPTLQVSPQTAPPPPISTRMTPLRNSWTQTI